MSTTTTVLNHDDDWSSRDYLKPTVDSYRSFRHLNYHTQCNTLQDGLNLIQRGNWTIQRPGFNSTETGGSM